MMYSSIKMGHKTDDLQTLITLRNTSVSNIPIRILFTVKIIDCVIIHITTVIVVSATNIITTYSCLNSFT